jgi:hypothetical protein
MCSRGRVGTLKLPAPTVGVAGIVAFTQAGLLLPLLTLILTLILYIKQQISRSDTIIQISRQAGRRAAGSRQITFSGRAQRAGDGGA